MNPNKKKIALALRQQIIGTTRTSIKVAEKLLPDFVAIKDQIDQIEQSLKDIDDRVIKSNLFYEVNSLRNRFSSLVEQSQIKEQVEDAITGLESYIG